MSSGPIAYWTEDAAAAGQATLHPRYGYRWRCPDCGRWWISERRLGGCPVCLAARRGERAVLPAPVGQMRLWEE